MMKVAVNAVVTLNIYDVIARAVDEGISYGLSRYNKYASRGLEPDAIEAIHEHVEREVMNALCEVIVWPEVV